MAKPRKKRRPVPDRGSALSPALIDGLDDAQELIDDGSWDQAHDLLVELDQRYPRQRFVLAMLLSVYQGLADYPAMVPVARELAALQPNDRAVAASLATAYLGGNYPFLAVASFQRYLQRWPEADNAALARDTVRDLTAEFPIFLADMNLVGDDGEEVARLLEEGRVRLLESDYLGSRQVFEQVLQRRPGHVPALTMIGVTYILEGRRDQAVTFAHRMLADNPDSGMALGLLTESLILLGREAEAGPWLDRLFAIPSDSLAVVLQQAEVASLLGDDARTLAVTEHLDEFADPDAPAQPTLLHLRAVALLRQGDEAASRVAWNEALALNPDLMVARANLDDLDKPADERHAPWPIALADWLSRHAVADLRHDVLPALSRNDRARLQRAVRRYVRKHPLLLTLTPALLDRGDPTGRILALSAAASFQTPESLAALRAFAAGTRGPARMRQLAANVVGEAMSNEQ